MAMDLLTALRLRFRRPSKDEAVRAAAALVGGKGGAVLLVTHVWGGGIARHVDDLALIIACAGGRALLMEPFGRGLTVIRAPGQAARDGVILDPSCGPQALAEVLNAAGVARVHLQSLAGYPAGAGDWLMEACARANRPYDITLHDYMSVCPRVHLMDENGRYCGEPDLAGCEACVSRRGSPFGRVGVADWRAMHERLLRGARQIIVPHEDVRERLVRHWPDMVFTVRPHAELRLKTLNLALIGTLDHHKGAGLVLQVAQAAKRLNLPLRFSVIGRTAMDKAFGAVGNVAVLGPYKEHDLARRLAEVKPDLVWFASTWPETYSYTLSAALQAGLSCVAFDLGAQGRRITEAGAGTVLPFALVDDPEVLARALVVAGTPALADAKALAAEHAPS